MQNLRDHGIRHDSWRVGNAIAGIVVRGHPAPLTCADVELAGNTIGGLLAADGYRGGSSSRTLRCESGKMAALPTTRRVGQSAPRDHGCLLLCGPFRARISANPDYSGQLSPKGRYSPRLLLPSVTASLGQGLGWIGATSRHRLRSVCRVFGGCADSGASTGDDEVLAAMS